MQRRRLRNDERLKEILSNYSNIDKDFYFNEIKKVHEYFRAHEYSLQAFYKTYVYALLNQNYTDDWLERCLKIREIGAKVTYDKMILLYGDDEGSKRWNEYRNKQAFSNSQEYKHMTDDEFRCYNKSRAVTLDNLIKKYGENKGEEKFKEYCQKQSFTNSLEYFQEKYGVSGYDKWKEYNTRKSHSLDAYKMNASSDDEAFKKYKEYWENKSSNFYSKMASELFLNIDETLKLSHVYYAPKTKEFGLYNKTLKRYTFYDFVIPDLKYCIEFNGDVFHGNPKLFEANDHSNPYNQNITCKDMWEYDKIKNDEIINQGFKLKIVWESEYQQNPQAIFDEIIKDITKLQNASRSN